MFIGVHSWLNSSVAAEPLWVIRGGITESAAAQAQTRRTRDRRSLFASGHLALHHSFVIRHSPACRSLSTRRSFTRRLVGEGRSFDIRISPFDSSVRQLPHSWLSAMGLLSALCGYRFCSVSATEIIEQFKALPATERAEVAKFIVEHEDSWIPEAFKEGMADAEAGRLVDLDTALNEPYPGDE